MNDYPRVFDVESTEHNKYTVVLKNLITNEVYEKFGVYNTFEEAEQEAGRLQNSLGWFRDE